MNFKRVLTVIKGVGKILDYNHPTEIKKALSSPIGFTLLIKGQAGTGKTTLALALLINTINAIYLTSRLSPSSLIKQFPWLKDHNCDDALIDASNFGFIDETIIAKFKKKIVFHNAPEFLLKIVEITEKMEHGTIIIDSWDAIIEKDLKEPKEILQKVEPFLMELVRQKNYNLVLVTEDKTHDYLDYLADGVVILEDRRVGMHRVRTIEMKKIRGVKCSQPEYVFSLNNGRFQYFPRFNLIYPSIMIKPPPIPDPNIEFVSTGIEDFDNLLGGGFKKGSWNFFEISHNIGQNYFAILQPFLINHLNLNRGVICILPEGLSFKGFLNYLDGFTNKEEIKKQIINFTIQEEKIEGVEEIVLDDDIDKTFSNLRNMQAKLEKTFPGPVLTFIGTDNLAHLYDLNELKKNLSKEVALRKTEKNVTITLASEKQNQIVRTLGHMVTNHWKLETYDKCLIFYGIQPETELHAVTYDATEGYISTNLTEIV
ncbi:MAG: hypothetical protein EAX96_01540 [Candidatus Lokiarchaeota archaeon]|nr:hypothetical protein [Candidatus Lokiarchaeota archaeon]